VLTNSVLVAVSIVNDLKTSFSVSNWVNRVYVGRKGDDCIPDEIARKFLLHPTLEPNTLKFYEREGNG
jgi:hypothetical protein